MKRKLTSFAITLLLILSLSLAGCSRVFDRSGAATAFLNAMCLGDYTSYSKYTGTSTADLSAAREEWLDSQTDRFIALFGDLNPSDETRDRIKNLFNMTYAAASYTAADYVGNMPDESSVSLVISETDETAGSIEISETVRETDRQVISEAEESSVSAKSASDVADQAETDPGKSETNNDMMQSASVTDSETSGEELMVCITIQPITLLTESLQEMQDYTTSFNEENEAFTYSASTPSEYADKYLEGILTILESKLSDISYGEKTKVIIRFRQNQEGLYAADEDDLLRLMNAILPFPE